MATSQGNTIEKKIKNHIHTYRMADAHTHTHTKCQSTANDLSQALFFVCVRIKGRF